MNPAPNIRAVFFDVGGTLITPWPSVGAVYARVGAAHGYHADPDILETAFRAAWKLCKQTVRPDNACGTSDKHWWRQLVYATMDQLGLDNDPRRRAAYFDELFATFARAEAWRLFDDVRDTLRAVRSRGIHVGALSNWDERLRPLLADLGIAQEFDSITVSCEVGVEKPHRRIFETALQRAGVPAAQALHIGDHPDEDVQGAQTAGIRALWIVRDNQPPPRPDGTISTLAELIPILTNSHA